MPWQFIAMHPLELSGLSPAHDLFCAHKSCMHLKILGETDYMYHLNLLTGCEYFYKWQ
jgi:hypothetical protein